MIFSLTNMALSLDIEIRIKRGNMALSLDIEIRIKRGLIPNEIL